MSFFLVGADFFFSFSLEEPLSTLERLGLPLSSEDLRLPTVALKEVDLLLPTLDLTLEAFFLGSGAFSFLAGGCFDLVVARYQ